MLVIIFGVEHLVVIALIGGLVYGFGWVKDWLDLVGDEPGQVFRFLSLELSRLKIVLFEEVHSTANRVISQCLVPALPFKPIKL